MMATLDLDSSTLRATAEPRDYISEEQAIHRASPHEPSQLTTKPRQLSRSALL